MTTSKLPHNGMWYETSNEKLQAEVDELDNSIRDTFANCESAPNTGPNWQYVRWVLGALLVGATWEAVFVVILGSGGDGKSTLLSFLSAVLGQYALAAAKAPFFRKGASQFKNHNSVSELMAYRNKRLLHCAECHLVEKKVPVEHLKQISSDKKSDILVVGKTKIPRTWGPIVFATNRVLPFEDDGIGKGDNAAIERRIITLLTKKPSKADPNFETVYLGEKKHVLLHWCVGLAKDYHKYYTAGKRLVNPLVQHFTVMSDMPVFFQQVSVAYATPRKVFARAMEKHFVACTGKSVEIKLIEEAYKQEVPHELLMVRDRKSITAMVKEFCSSASFKDPSFYGLRVKEERFGDDKGASKRASEGDESVSERSVRQRVSF